MMAVTSHRASLSTGSAQAAARSGDRGDGNRADFLILGGGISGLSLAVWLREKGIEAVVLDKADRPGGVIGTIEKDGFVFERGPNTILDKYESLDELAKLVGLEAEVERTPMADHDRYIWHGGRLHKVPTSPPGILKTGLLSFGAKFRLLRELSVGAVEEDETLECFVVRRLGRQAYERAFVPMVQGIWAGDPARMSTEATFPLLKELERTHGSLIRGLNRGRNADQAKTARAKGEPTRQMVSYRGGLQRLPEALAAKLGPAYRPGVEVREINETESGFQISAAVDGHSENWFAEKVALCAEAGTVAGWIEDVEPNAAARLRAVHYCPLAVVGLGVETGGSKIPSGFGFLVAPNHGLRILGAIFNSNFIPGRAPEGCAALTVMIGGDLDPQAATLDEQALLDLARRDVEAALGGKLKVRCHHIERWSRAIPQYHMDHFAIVTELEKVEQRHPGLHLFGNWRGGVALGERIERAKELGERIAETTRKETERG